MVDVVMDPSAVSSRTALRFATREEAAANVQELMMRWFAVRETRVVESDDPVNYLCIDGRLESLTSEAATPAQYVQPRWTACLVGFFRSTHK